MSGLDRIKPRATHHARVNLTRLGRQLAEIGQGLSGDRLLDYGARESPYRTLFPGFSEIVSADLPGEGADLSLHADGSIPQPDGSYDCVLSTQVLEHVPDVQAYLGEARRVLGLGGVLVLSTHGVHRYHADPNDFWRWTGPGLRSVLEAAGFEVQHIHPLVVGPAASLSMTIQLLADVVPNRLRGVWNGVGQFFVDWLDRIASRRAWDDAAIYVTVSTLREGVA